VVSSATADESLVSLDATASAGSFVGPLVLGQVLEVPVGAKLMTLENQGSTRYGISTAHGCTQPVMAADNAHGRRCL
jgi:hypothetical protein